MAFDQTSATQRVAQQLTLLEQIDRLSRFDGPPEQFVQHLLAVQCEVAPARGGAVLRATMAAANPATADGEDQPRAKADVIAVHPAMKPGETAPVWLAQSVESAPKAFNSSKTVTVPVRRANDLYGQPPSECILLLPLSTTAGLRGVAAFVVDSANPRQLDHVRERLELTIGLLGLYEMRLALQQRSSDLARMQQAMEVLADANDQPRFRAVAMAVCNNVADRWNADRVSLGFLKGRYIHLRAMSHTEKFTRKMQLVQDIESAMEECLDQDVELVHPAAPDATYVARATTELATRHGPAAICSLPLRRGDDVVGVLTVERAADRPFTLEQIELLRLACDLCAPRLAELHEHDQWFGARLAADARKALAALLGPRYTWVKLIAIVTFAVIVFLTFFKGEDRAKGDFTIQPIDRQIIAAPFDGQLESVFVQPGDMVVADQTVLATLHTIDLRLQLDDALNQREGYLQEADIALRDGKPVDRQVALIRAEQVEPTIARLRYRIEQAAIRSPVSGTVIQGDLRRQVGGPLAEGDALFEVAPIGSDQLRAELYIPEDRIESVRVGQTGQLAAASHPGDYLPFTVERIDPVAQVVEQSNVFVVRVRLTESRPWLKPGMGGVGKITMGRRAYGYILTRDLVNWLRMKLWL